MVSHEQEPTIEAAEAPLPVSPRPPSSDILGVWQGIYKVTRDPKNDEELKTDLIAIADHVASILFPESVNARQFPYVGPDGKPVRILFEEPAYRDPGGQKAGETRVEPNKVRYQEPIRRATARIAERAEEIVEALIQKAIGIKTLRRDRQGNEVEVYLEPPSESAAKILLDRLMGKPTEHKEVDINAKSQVENIHLYIPVNNREAKGFLTDVTEEAKALPSPESAEAALGVPTTIDAEFVSNEVPMETT